MDKVIVDFSKCKVASIAMTMHFPMNFTSVVLAKQVDINGHLAKDYRI